VPCPGQVQKERALKDPGAWMLLHGIAASPGWSEVKVSRFKEAAFHHFVGDRGRGRTKGFHKELIRKLNVQITDISFRVSFPETPEDTGKKERLRGGARVLGRDLPW